ncbi:hypothetical protein [Chitinophaga sp.]|uniref:hypothetical protein n=1 Tax=Chitinophaga sp. TaxID=1869181 RepID=UPI002F9351EE
MKKIQTIFLLVALCFAMGSANAAAGSNSLWYMSKNFSNYDAAKRLTPIAVHVNVVTLLGLPISVCSVLGQTLISGAYVYQVGAPILRVQVQCYNYEQQTLIWQVAPGDEIHAYGYVIGTGFNSEVFKIVTAADISAGILTLNLLL